MFVEVFMKKILKTILHVLDMVALLTFLTLALSSHLAGYSTGMISWTLLAVMLILVKMMERKPSKA